MKVQYLGDNCIAFENFTTSSGGSRSTRREPPIMGKNW